MVDLSHILSTLDTALNLSPEERRAFLADFNVTPELIRRLETEVGADPLRGAEMLALVEDLFAKRHFVGKAFGPFRVIDVLGQGGMGVVLLADQHEPVKRRVALKTLRPGRDSSDHRVRFHLEYQLLAGLKHPNIATMYDAGGTEQAPAWFAMEYVPGVPITDYCTQHDLSLAPRLALLRQACAGIAHAHEKGVVHRDVKPTNMLVYDDGQGPVLKLIDFGIAKFLGTIGPAATHVGQLLGTPLYMAPEQFNTLGPTSDSRCDVYALGCVLYELLVGHPPFPAERLRDRSLVEIATMVCEEQPVPPSRLLQASPEEVGSVYRVAGDLDWICLKAVAKSPDDRYRSPRDLSLDLERFLAHRPVSVGPPRPGYRLGKFVKRHRHAVAWASIGLVLTCMAMTIAWFSFFEAESSRARSRDLASQAADAEVRHDAVVEFMTQSFAATNPEAVGEVLTPTQFLDRAAAYLEDEMTENPKAKARAHAQLAQAYGGLQLFDQAQHHIDVALALQKRLLGERHPDTLSSFNRKGWLLYLAGDTQGAKAFFRDLIDEQMGGLSSTDGLRLQVRRRFAHIVHAEGDWAQAGDIYEALTHLYAQTDEPSSEVWLTQLGLANVARDSGDFDLAEDLYRGIHASQRKQLGERHPQTWNTLENLAILLTDLGRIAEAEPILRELVEQRTQALGPMHHQTQKNQHRLARLLVVKGASEEAERLLQPLVSDWTRRLGPDHPLTLSAGTNLGVVLVDLDRAAEASAVYRSLMDAYVHRYGSAHPETLKIANNLADVQMRLGAFDQAEALLVDTLERKKKALGAYHASTLATQCTLGELAEARGRVDVALSVYTTLVKTAVERLPADHSYTAIFSDYQTRVALEMDDAASAERILLDTYAFTDNRASTVASATAQALAHLYERLGDRTSMQAWLRRVEKASGSPD